MNRKGVAVKALVWTIVMAVVVVTVIIGIYMWGNSATDWIRIHLFGYDLNYTTNEDLEILSYDIYNDTAQYYDGIRWNKLRENTKIGDKTINGDRARYYFADNYYLNEQKRDLGFFFLLDNYENEIIDRTYERDAVIIDFNKYGKAGVLVNVRYNGGATNFLIGLDGSIQYQTAVDTYEPFDDVDDPEDEIREKADRWRDSVLAEPMHFKYNNSQYPGIWVCVEKYDPSYLVTDLTKEVSSDHECPTDAQTLPEYIPPLPPTEPDTEPDSEESETELPETEPLPANYFAAALDIVTDPEAFPQRETDAMTLFASNSETGASREVEIYIALPEKEIYTVSQVAVDPQVGVVEDGVMKITVVIHPPYSELESYLVQLNNKPYQDLLDGKIALPENE